MKLRLELLGDTNLETANSYITYATSLFYLDNYQESYTFLNKAINLLKILYG